MNLQQYISNPPVGVNGTKVLFAGQSESLRGQCVQLVEDYAVKVLGVKLPIIGQAKNYWTAIPGFTQQSSPQAGDIAVYNGHGIYTDGHIAIFAGNGQVFEQNADPDGSPAHLFARANTYLLGYLRKDTVMELFNEGDRQNFNTLFYGKDNQQFGSSVGKDWKTACTLIMQQVTADKQLLVNAGDVANLASVGITNASQANGTDWKNAVYSVILKNLPGGTRPTLLVPGEYLVQ